MIDVRELRPQTEDNSVFNGTTLASKSDPTEFIVYVGCDICPETWIDRYSFIDDSFRFDVTFCGTIEQVNEMLNKEYVLSI